MSNSPREKKQVKPGKRTFLLIFSSLLVGLFLGLLLIEVTLRFLTPQWIEFSSARFMKMKIVPGHIPVAMCKPNFNGYFSQNNGNFRVKININSFGFREKENIDQANDRIWIIGDSMAFGWGVEENERYSNVLSNLINEKTYNLASPGTALCGYQAIISQLPEHLIPKSIILGLVLENDVQNYKCKENSKKWHLNKNSDQNLNNEPDDLKLFLTKRSALYNFFTVSIKRLEIVNKFFVSLGLIKKPHISHNLINKVKIPSLVADSVREILNLKSMLPQNTPFYVLIAPTRIEIRDAEPNSRFLRESITEKLLNSNITVIDPFKAFRKEGFSPTHFTHDGHWSKLGHELAAREIAKVINKTD